MLQSQRTGAGRCMGARTKQTLHKVARSRQVATQAAMKALVWDCDGVIVETEELHRKAYNAAFKHFDAKCGNKPDSIDWSVEFYDILQNTVGGGKPKMRWYFAREGWPTSSVLGGKAPTNDEEKALLVDTLQEWKSFKFQDMVKSGEAECRPGVLRVMEEARAAGLKIAVCSAGTKESVINTLVSLLGEERFKSLDCFLAGDDVKEKKPDPTIYKMAAEKMKLKPEECLVIEDSTIGLRAALGAGMRCIITYTSGTAKEEFQGAEIITEVLGDNPALVSLSELLDGPLAQTKDLRRVAVTAA